MNITQTTKKDISTTYRYLGVQHNIILLLREEPKNKNQGDKRKIDEQRKMTNKIQLTQMERKLSLGKWLTRKI
jgi:hypothetical protein